MAVTSTKGERLGNVIRTGAETFVVEKGVFFPKDYELRYDHITALSGDEISYTLSDVDTRRGAIVGSAPASTTPAMARAAAAPRPVARAPAVGTTTTEEVRIPLVQEEIGIEKVAREIGHVRIHKTVRTEEKHFTVPVTREDIVIERVSGSGEEVSSELAFREQTLDVPLHEEEVRITKHSRVREQIVVHPVVQAVEKEASASLRHEEAEIEDTRGRTLRETDGEVTRPGYGAPGRNR
jgi:uncharacterized protein (TIGR02271 family)